MTPDEQAEPTPDEPAAMASNARGVSIAVLVVLVIGLITAIAVGFGGGDDERLTTAPGTVAATTGPTTAPPGSIEVKISDEPVRIDADGTITDGTEVLGTIRPSETTPVDETDDGLNLLGGDDPEDRKMPDVVCFGLQRAQDEIQDRGVFGSKSVDATGEGRRQIWDRNWIVVSQEPAAGEPIGEFEAVLSVMKNDEGHSC